MRLRCNKTATALFAYSGVIALFALLIASGALDVFAGDAAIDRQAISVLVVYWVIGSFVLVVVFEVRRHPKEILLMLGAVLVVFLSLEIILRTFLLFPDKTLPREYFLASRQFHHVLPSNQKMHLESPDGKPYSIITNEDGFRTRYSRRDFLRHKHRIAILGDSFTYGLGVQRPFPEILEEFLRDTLQSDQLAVLNTGLTSYSPLLERAVYEGKLRAYEPTLVVLVFDATDIGDDYIYLGEAHQAGDSVWFNRKTVNAQRYYGPLHHWLMPLFLYPFDVAFGWASGLPPSHKETYNYYEFELMLNGVKETNRFFIYRHPLEVTRPFFEKTLSFISSLARMVRSDGGDFVLVVPPRYHHWSEKECPNDWGRVWYFRDDQYQFEYLKFFETVKESVSYTVFNMLTAFQTTGEYPLVFENDPHWNERGHAFVARVLGRYLLDRGLVR